MGEKSGKNSPGFIKKLKKTPVFHPLTQKNLFYISHLGEKFFNKNPWGKNFTPLHPPRKNSIPKKTNKLPKKEKTLPTRGEKKKAPVGGGFSPPILRPIIYKKIEIRGGNKLKNLSNGKPNCLYSISLPCPPPKL